MKLELIKPLAALNKAYKKSSLNEDQIALFKLNLLTLFNRINEKETEEHLKNIVSDFLKDTYYKGKHEVNTKGRQDLAIHTDKTSASNVGVIIEAKHPNNKSGMISKANPNAKALHELMHYYLQERFIKGNKEIKHLIVTNIYEWYIFDGADFERFFFENKKLTKEYKDWNDGLFGVKKTDWFYEEVAHPFIEHELEMLPCTYFNLKEIEKVIKRTDKSKDNTLIDFYKILSSEHLLKKPFANDTNILNKDFYNELLHLLGLEETKETGKKLIKRKKEESRNEGSLLENTINILKTRNKLVAFENTKQFGENEEEQLFSLGLELCITWLNRILFLKLLEGQLKKYHLGDRAYEFLNYNKIKDFDELNELFFEVLAVSAKKRTKSVVDKFGSLPYLNSSLFEESEIERKSLVISDLKDRLKIPVLSSTVLKEASGKKILGSKNTLEYLFEFLDAYNFESDSKAEIQTVSKTIINASVLGLIFEKINGYKDGSFFTPSFITMYMSRETIRKAVVQKFNEQYNWQCNGFNDLFNKLDKISLAQANATIDNLKICDPAVGSGHFLVSALNEIITIKNDLEILTDAEGKRLRGYHISTENDELIITCEEEHFVYNYKDKESRRIQETLFHEKQKIIENSLFGVDINPKSVMICRLRLWIELLKNMYYTQSSNYTELETLPNIDINIKCGNSLVYRFDIKDSYAKIPIPTQQKIKLATQKYKDQVMIYKSTADKATKKLAEKNIAELKQTFSSIANPTDTDYIKWKEVEAKLGELPMLFSREDKEEWNLKFEIITKEAETLKNKYAHKLETLYGNSFEWRFEFPEVLNEDGQFVGFDVVIGNPPYGVTFENIEKDYLKKSFSDIHVRTPESFNYFVKQFSLISSSVALCSFIIPSGFLNQAEFEKTRKIILNEYSPFLILNLGDGVFEDVATPTCIVGFSKLNKYKTAKYADLTATDRNILPTKIYSSFKEIELQSLIENQSHNFVYQEKNYKSIIDKCYKNTPTLKEVAEEVATGISSGLDKAYVFTSDEIKEKNIENDILKKLIVGGEINRFYLKPVSNKKIIYITDENNIDELPNVKKEISFYKDQLVKRREAANGKIEWYSLNWPRRKKLFDDPKILIRQTANKIMAAYDDEKWYCLKSGLIVQLPEKSGLDYFFLVGLLNSTLFDFLYHDLVNEDNRIFPEVKPIQLFKLPIKTATKTEQKEISKIAKAITASKTNNPNTNVTKLENELNVMVYELYGITPEEQRIIEGERIA